MDFLLPPLGEGLVEVELIRWLVQPGDTVVRGQALAEVMSDKATMEVPAPFAGKIVETLAEIGTKIRIGEPFLRYLPADASMLPTKVPVAGIQVSSPESGTQELKSRQPGSAAGETATTSETEVSQKRSPSKAGPGITQNGASPLSAPAAPSVRHLARKLGVDLTKIRGSGPGGRILLDDLTAYLNAPSVLEPSAASAATKTPRIPHPLHLGSPGTRQKLVGLRRTIAERMVQSERSIPHYSYIDECEVTELVRLRSQLKESFAARGLKLTYLPFLIKAVTRALKEVPIVNSTYDESAEEIHLHGEYHIGIAVATPGGLVVPVIHHADRRDLFGLTEEVERLSSAARAGRSRLDDLRGGTFTITSVGSIGGLISTPIINRPEVGIMAVGKLIRRPVYDSGNNLRPAEMLYLSFSFDHRIVDGAVGAVFGNAVIRQLQQPACLLLPEEGSF
jgi:2-oxoisovalerate dehydrogenase E2 component (dihydrolipoyl transacylase)